MTARVRLYTRSGCHLCEPAREVVASTCAALGQEWAEFDVDADPATKERFTDQVPVATVDGEVVGFWRIDPDRLRAALV
ncbi:glutaredoxin family protein [Demequina pelophila]|uniref:glutaredoxin family protein n=1 Tax=Demequina pelophila TaxID=1638984 RepID=UPI0007816D3F|nr:glutaredoxin family protein [Demequina pelophila]